MTGCTRALIAAGLLATASAATSARQTAGWLERPSPWNKAGTALPAPPKGAETPEALRRRCGMRGETTEADSAVMKAGWTPFLHLDRRLTRGDVEVAAGMSAASPGCVAETFNLFVFVGGRFAGTISPMPMTPGRDGDVGAVRITGADSLTAEFARYAPGDPECCPSSRMRVTYRIERTGGPVLLPVEARQIR